MTDDNKRLNVAAEIEKGERTFRAAEICLAGGLPDDAISRAYYAAFHFVTALLYSAGLEARTHGGTHDLFHLHFVRTGLFDGRWSRVLSALQQYREKADYARQAHYAEADAREELEKARALCDAIRAYLVAGAWLTP